MCRSATEKFGVLEPSAQGLGVRDGGLCDPGLQCSSVDRPQLPGVTGLLVSLRYQPVSDQRYSISQPPGRGAVSARPPLPKRPLLGVPSPVEARGAGPRPVATRLRARLRAQARSLCKGSGQGRPWWPERCSGPVGLPCLTFASMAWMRSEWPASSFRLQLGVGGSRQPMGGEQVQNQNGSAEGGVARAADRSAGEGKATWQWPPPRDGLLPASLPPGLPSNPSCEGLIILPS